MSGRSARAGRVAGAVCLTTLMAASLTACAASPDERIAGKRWQVTEIYDDPALPRGVPEGTMPPMIATARYVSAARSAPGVSSCATQV